jgi:hypothetical protein
MSSLVIYIPTFANPEGALYQVIALNAQREAVADPPWNRVQIVLAANSGDYDVSELMAAGADEVRVRQQDVGGDINIGLGFLEAREGDFLWILSDNDPVAPSALDVLSTCFHDDAIDMVIGADELQEPQTLTSLDEASDSGMRVHTGLISAVVYRYSAIREAAPVALRMAWTGWGHLAVQRHGSLSGHIRSAMLVPLSDLVTLTRGDSTNASVARARAGYSHSYFGSGVLAYLMAETETPTSGGRALTRWWRSQWIYGSAYRVPKQGLGQVTLSYPSQRAVQDLVHRLLRSGSPMTRLRLMASYLPYWRVGVALRNRGIRLKRWY